MTIGKKGNRDEEGGRFRVENGIGALARQIIVQPEQRVKVPEKKPNGRSLARVRAMVEEGITNESIAAALSVGVITRTESEVLHLAIQPLTMYQIADQLPGMQSNKYVEQVLATARLKMNRNNINL